MAEEKMDFTSQFINQIKAQISALQGVLASVEQASAVGALRTIAGIDLPSQALVGRGDSLGVPADLPQGAFIGKSVPACIELYLSAVKKKQTNKEIAAALQEGGVESNASTFSNTVTAALFKLKNDGVVLRFKDGWGLSAWYPAHIRAINPTTSPKKAKKKGRKKEPKNAPETRAAMPPKRKAGDVIVEVLKAKPDREYRLEEIAELAGLGVKFVRLTLGKLLKAGRVRMSAPGVYVIGRPQLVAAGD